MVGSELRPPLFLRSPGDVLGRVLGLLVAGVLLVSLAAPSAPASAAPVPGVAGTIVFVRAGDVWIARADGSGQRALTSDGTSGEPYRTPTQDDGGHVLAVRGRGTGAVVVRMDQQGQVLRRFSLPVTSLGPDFLSVSPDGHLLAYETVFATPDCSYTPCHTFFQHYVEYARADTGAASPGAHHVVDGEFASWAGSSRTVVQSTFLNRVLLHRPTEAAATEWFASCLSFMEGCGDTDTLNYYPAVNRQGSWLAVSRIEDGPAGRAAFLLLLSSDGAATATRPALPGAGCAYEGPAPTSPDPASSEMTISAPSFSPSGVEVVFAERRGTAWTTKVYRPVLGDCDASDPVTVIADASQPHWSAAALRAPAPALGHGTDRDRPAASSPGWKRHRLPRIKGVAKVGHRLKVSLRPRALRRGFRPRVKTIKYRWFRGRKPIKHATGTVYRPTTKDRHRRLRVRIVGKARGLDPGQVFSRARKIK